MVTAGGPIGRLPAQRIAREELTKGIYSHTSFWEYLLNKLHGFYARIVSGVPGGWWATVSMAALLVVIVAVVTARIGPLSRRRRAPVAALLGGAEQTTAREHRDLARQHAADGDYSAAITERVRAISASLEERAFLLPGPARTADELAREASGLFPAHTSELTAAARQFDDVCYGQRTGTADGYARVERLDEALGNAKTAVSL
jgi:hypothetical protein